MDSSGRHAVAPAKRSVRQPMRFSISNWPVAARLVAVFIVASVTGLAFGGIRVSDAVNTAAAFGRTAQLAILGQRITALAQAMENERDSNAGVAAINVLASDAAADKAAASVTGPINAMLAREKADLAAAEQETNAEARQTAPLADAIGGAFPASLQAKAENVVTTINGMPALRSAVQGQSPSDVIESYSTALGNLFAFNEEITSGSGDPVLADDVSALSALSNAKDQASQQRAILYSALLEASVNDAGGGGQAPSNTIGSQALNDAGGLSALTTAQGLQVADLEEFDNAASPAQANSYLTTVAGLPDNEVDLLENFVGQPNDPRQIFETMGAQQTSLGFTKANVAATWYSNATTVIDQMRSVESQIATTIVARAQLLQQQAVGQATVTAALTAGAVLLVLLVTALIGRTLVNPLRRLQADALEIAASRLPARVAAAASGASEASGPEAEAAVEPIGVRSTDEIGRVARAFDQVHAEAVRLAGTEARLRGSLSAMFISLSRRSVPLIDRLARIIESMEQNEDDPDQLANLFAMDHMVTRMRRNSENLLVLGGEEPVRKWSKPVSLSDVARAAAAEIEQYNRVALAVQPGIAVSGHAAADVVHLLAELIENATLFSPMTTQVRVTVTEPGSGGVLIEVRDEGVGISAERLADINWRLDHPPVVDVSISRHMGLYAVARLAARHGIKARLRPGAPHGLSALVWLPGHLVEHGTAAEPGDGSWAPVARLAPGRTVRHRTAPPNGSYLTLAGHRAPGGRPGMVWFTAKRPSGHPASTGGTYGTDGTGESPGRTSAGLPKRVPRMRPYPGSDMPATGIPAVAPAGEPDTQHHVQPPPPRRSPEEARRRLSGFQLGTRDAVQAQPVQKS